MKNSFGIFIFAFGLGGILTGFKDSDPWWLFVISTGIMLWGSQMVIQDLIEKNSKKERKGLEEKIDALENEIQSKQDVPPNKKIPDEEVYKEALELLKQRDKVSTSFLQRKLRIGFSQAYRVLDSLQSKGLVARGNKDEIAKDHIVEPEYDVIKTIELKV